MSSRLEGVVARLVRATALRRLQSGDADEPEGRPPMQATRCVATHSSRRTKRFWAALVVGFAGITSACSLFQQPRSITSEYEGGAADAFVVAGHVFEPGEDQLPLTESVVRATLMGTTYQQINATGTYGDPNGLSLTIWAAWPSAQSIQPRPGGMADVVWTLTASKAGELVAEWSARRSPGCVAAIYELTVERFSGSIDCSDAPPANAVDTDMRVRIQFEAAQQWPSEPSAS